MSNDKKKTAQENTVPSSQDSTAAPESPKEAISAREFAEHLYDLDKLVYELSGSSLARLYQRPRAQHLNH